MAQQLANLRTPAAYSGVTSYARSHKGEASAAAYLALGHAYMLDKRYADAVSSLKQAKEAGDSLEDYDDFLAAKAYHESDQEAQAEALLKGFRAKYPDSIFVDEVPELEANVLLDLHDAAGAKRVLDAAASDPAAGRAGYQLAAGLVAQAQNENTEALRIYKALLLGFPLSTEAAIARAKLSNLGAEDSLTSDELRSLGDAYYRAGRYEDAGDQYRTLSRKANLDEQSRNGFAVAAAACDLKLKRLTENQVQALPDTRDENGARRAYLLMELARNRNDLDAQTQIVTRMETDFPQSQWLAEALFSSGNMYLLRKEYARAAEYYAYLGDHFSSNKNGSAAHWRAGWLNYRLGNFKEAARIFDEQILNSRGLQRRRRRSTGGAACMRRRITTRRRRRRTTARSCACINTSSTRRWRGNGLLRWAPQRRRRHRILKRSRLRNCPIFLRAFPRTALTLQKPSCWPTRG